MYKTTQELVLTTQNAHTTLELGYQLIDNSLVDRWLDLVNYSLLQKYSLSVQYRKILEHKEILTKFNEFVKTVEKINANYHRSLSVPNCLELLLSNQKFLNQLHAEYEMYGELRKNNFLSDQSSSHTQLLNDCMLRLNNQIHDFELIAAAQKNNNLPCNALIDWVPAGKHGLLEPDDYLLFNADFLWGHLYLGYNTLGKNWQAASIDNDIDLLKREAVQPQKRFAAEFYVEFKLKHNMYYMQNHFYNWVKKHGLSKAIQSNMAFLGLGQIPLGRLKWYKLDNSTFVIDWSAMNQHYQKNWNISIWSQFDSIKDVTIKNSQR